MNDFQSSETHQPNADADGASGYLTIDLAALARNYKRLCDEVAPANVAAVVKANAYGLGVDRIAPKLYDQGCRHFFVAQFTEALALRPLISVDAAIFVLNGLQPGNEELCAHMDIIPVINSLEQWSQWASVAKTSDRTLSAVVQFDTGMSRLGVPPEDRAALADLVKAESRLHILYIMSHLASADDAGNVQNFDQCLEMEKAAAEFSRFPVCFANSAGIFLGAAYHGVLVRPGVALYGGAPTGGHAYPMERVVRLDVAVVQTRTVPAGARIGYSASHTTRQEKRLATIAAGYADGLPRCLSDKGAVYCDRTRLPIVGRVSMDSVIVDISALPQDRLTLGCLVEVIGPNQTLEDLAHDAGTISYEILTGLGHRYQRRYR